MSAKTTQQFPPTHQPLPSHQFPLQQQIRSTIRTQPPFNPSTDAYCTSQNQINGSIPPAPASQYEPQINNQFSQQPFQVKFSFFHVMFEINQVYICSLCVHNRT